MSKASVKTLFARWVWLPAIVAVIVALDQWSKGLIERNLPLGGAYVPFPALEPWFKLVHFTNTGAAFGLLQGQGSLFVLVALVVIVAALIYARQLPGDSWIVRLCLGLQLGGAIGNLIDRLQHQGHVTDFLLFTLPVGDKVYMWPAFNVADSSIVVGVIGLALLLLRAERKLEGKHLTAVDNPSAEEQLDSRIR